MLDIDSPMYSRYGGLETVLQDSAHHQFPLPLILRSPIPPGERSQSDLLASSCGWGVIAQTRIPSGLSSTTLPWPPTIGGLGRPLQWAEHLGRGQLPRLLIHFHRYFLRDHRGTERVKTLEGLLEGSVQSRLGQNLSRSRLRCKVSKNPVNAGQNLAEGFDGPSHHLLHAQSRQTSPISADPKIAAPGPAARTSAGSRRNAPRGDTTKV